MRKGQPVERKNIHFKEPLYKFLNNFLKYLDVGLYTYMYYL